MIVWRLIVVVGVLAVAQAGWLAAWRPFGLVPNLLLAAAVGLSLRGAVRPVMVAAAAAGLVVDLGSGVHFGLWTVALPAAALAAKLLQRTGIIGNSLAVGAIVVAVGTLVTDGLVILSYVGVLRSWSVGWFAARLGGDLLVGELLFVAMWPLWRWPVLPHDTLPGVRHL